MQWVNRRIHVSWLVATVCVGLVSGTALAPVVSIGLLPMSIYLLVSIVILLWAFNVRKAYVLPVLLLVGSLLGAWRAETVLQDLTAYDSKIGETVILRAKILEDPAVDRSGQAVLRLGDVSVGGDRLPGRVWATVGETGLKRGNYVIISGRLDEGFGTFSAAIYRAKLITYQSVENGDVAREIRDTFSTEAQKYIDEPAISLGLGYLTGQRRGLPPDLLQTLQVAGLTHIIVASGYNLTILVRLMRRLFEKHSKYLATVMPGVLVVSFIAVTGMSPSMSRAGLVTGLSLLAWYYGRRFHPLVLLSITAAVTVSIEPSYAWGDIGWLLSFAAFTGVMILAPLLQAYFYGAESPGVLRQVFGETLSAHIFTLPILVVSFGQFSNVALPANLMILPLIPIVMLGVFLTGVLGFVAPQLAEIIAWPTSLILNYMIGVAEWWASQPWAVSELSIDWYWAAGCYLGLIAICVYLRYATGLSLRRSSIVD